jgi:hypothetical protein
MPLCVFKDFQQLIFCGAIVLGFKHLFEFVDMFLVSDESLRARVDILDDLIEGLLNFLFCIQLLSGDDFFEVCFLIQIFA